MSDLFVGGTETTTTSIRWAILFFLYHPEVQEKMFKEIDKVVGISRRPSLEDRSQLSYCEAVITEVLRCGNIAPLGIQRSCRADVYYKGFIIPKGSIIISNLNSVMKDSSLFENAEKFQPERFINTDGEFCGHNKVIAFSIGKCIFIM